MILKISFWNQLPHENSSKSTSVESNPKFPQQITWIIQQCGFRSEVPDLSTFLRCKDLKETVRNFVLKLHLKKVSECFDESFFLILPRVPMKYRWNLQIKAQLDGKPLFSGNNNFYSKNKQWIFLALTLAPDSKKLIFVITIHYRIREQLEFYVIEKEFAIVLNEDEIIPTAFKFF